MPNESYKSNSASQGDQLDLGTIRELHRLFGRAYDEVLTEEEGVLLDTYLNESPAARTLYYRYVELHALLLTKVGTNQRLQVELLRSRVNEELGEESALPKAVGNAGSNTFKATSDSRSSHILWATAAMILLALTAAIFQFSAGFSEPSVDSLVSTEGPQLPNDSTVEKQSQQKDVVLSYVSLSATSGESRAYNQQDALEPGQRLELGEGEIELTYPSGTKLLLIGPADFVVQPTGGQLSRGGLVASVTEAGHGFTIDTPNGKVVDLGTEFGVAVDDFGLSEVSVFQGKVEAFHKLPNGRKKKHELTKGRGLQWNKEVHTLLDADLRRFAASVLDRSPSEQNLDSEPQLSLVDRFRQDSIDKKKWKSMGAVNSSPNGLRLVGNGETSSLPYLISRQQYNPSEGPITIRCDFRFLADGKQAPSSISVLTRSAERRGVALEPWKDVLASCARCSFEIEAGESPAGVLLAGVKMESVREMSHISGTPFLDPQPNAPYRLLVVDDGVNVTLTVSLRDDPSKSKTVTFRSLFRGESNHIAIEGALHGAVLVDELEITQELTEASVSSYADFASLLHKSQRRSELEREILASMIPQDSVLVLEEDFEGEELDDQRWNSLGDVAITEGALQLGKPNAAAHIDTWKERPYLLTLQSIDPTVAPVTILGRVTFADNFLNGYGASFAVMTRADGLHGQGPGWEYSILRRGMRANFWPAAWDSEHSLEIHEKPTPNTVTLLATQGLEVDPRRKSYVFRVVDEGDTVTLTIIDPLRPEIPMTISSRTDSRLSKGLIGFESCWGSPVTLDDVRIYQTLESRKTP